MCSFSSAALILRLEIAIMTSQVVGFNPAPNIVNSLLNVIKIDSGLNNLEQKHVIGKQISNIASHHSLIIDINQEQSSLRTDLPEMILHADQDTPFRTCWLLSVRYEHIHLNKNELVLIAFNERFLCY